MKKLFTIALVLVLCMSLSITAFAVETVSDLTPPSNNVNVPIRGTAAITGGGIVYSIDVDWGGMSFTYTASEGTWNPTTLAYDGTSDSGWAVNGEEGADHIKVENHSNAPVHAALAATMLGSYTAITPAVSNGTAIDSLGATFGAAGNVELQSADNTLGAGGAHAATYASFVVSLSGKPGKDLAADTMIGRVDVTITAGT